MGALCGFCGRNNHRRDGLRASGGTGGSQRGVARAGVGGDGAVAYGRHGRPGALPRSYKSAHDAGDGRARRRATPGLTARRDCRRRIQAAGTAARGDSRLFSAVPGDDRAQNWLGKNEITQQIGGARKELKLNEDFVPFSFSSSGEAAGTGGFRGIRRDRAGIRL